MTEPDATPHHASPYDATVINHVGQCVTDLERSTRFYTELLEFTLDHETEIPDQVASLLLGVEAPVGLKVRYLRRGSFLLELLAFDRPNNPPAQTRAFNEPGLTHLSFSVPDLAATTARVVELGGTVVTDLGLATIIRDPDGQVVELLTMDYRRHRDAEHGGQP